MSILTILQLIAVAVAALKNVPGVTGEVAAWITVLDTAITNAVTAHQTAIAKVDPTQLHDITPVP
jgi:hypothetical protein